MLGAFAAPRFKRPDESQVFNPMGAIDNRQRTWGMACWPGSHKKGPMVHSVTPTGQLELPGQAYENYQREDLSKYEIGDAFFMNLYLVHETSPIGARIFVGLQL